MENGNFKISPRKIPKGRLQENEEAINRYIMAKNFQVQDTWI